MKFADNIYYNRPLIMYILEIYHAHLRPRNLLKNLLQALFDS